jgi:plastocyanin domain-containing protein
MLQINHAILFRYYIGHDIKKQQELCQGNWSHDWDMNQIQVITNRNNRLGLKSCRRKTMGRKWQGWERTNTCRQTWLLVDHVKWIWCKKEKEDTHQMQIKSVSITTNSCTHSSIFIKNTLKFHVKFIPTCLESQMEPSSGGQQLIIAKVYKWFNGASPYSQYCGGIRKPMCVYC